MYRNKACATMPCREAVAAAGSLKVPTEAAWALRHAFDSILGGAAQCCHMAWRLHLHECSWDNQFTP